MSLRRTANRNREILAGFEAGLSVEALGERHGLTLARIRTILIDEKHRRNLSPEPFYRVLRNSC